MTCETHRVHGKALYRALTIAFIFMGVEVIGGVMAKSLALISDALHLFTDVGALALSVIVLKIVHLPSTPKMSYGYHRAEILGALASAISLWALSGILIYEAITRLIHPEMVKGPIVFVIAGVGLIANIVMLRILHPTHAHNLNMRAAYLHVVGDLLASIAVLIGGAILWLTQWNPIDPIITLLFSTVILFSSGKIIRQSVVILMESTPAGIDPLSVQEDLQNLQGVIEVHDLHIWSASGKKVVLSVHLVTNDPQTTLNAAHCMLEEKHNIQHMTIQVEDPSHFQQKYCYDCQKV